MDKVIIISGQNYILATSVMAEERIRVLKQEETFAVFDRYGDIYNVGLGEEGLYHEGTRFLSRLDLKIGEERPLLLSSAITEDNAMLTIDLTNPDMNTYNLAIVRGTVHILRMLHLWNGHCFERLRVTNFTSSSVTIPLHYTFGADFADIFEIRGQRRQQRGTLFEPRWQDGALDLSYLGLDDIIRSLRLRTSQHPSIVSSYDLTFDAQIGPRQTWNLFLEYSCHVGEASTETRALPKTVSEAYNVSLKMAEQEIVKKQQAFCSITTSNEQFNNWLLRSQADINMMLSHDDSGYYPYAGVPWFSTTFGRDGIITALQLIWCAPDVARGVLSFLAKTQAQELDPKIDAEPGKILHEARRGEMANLGEIPFKRYYGTVDATPLFIVLAGAYFDFTGDLAFIESIWPNIERALHWIDEYGDRNNDGFVEYDRRSSNGLVNQGWKDSDDSVFHRDGTNAEPPIALCEIQGYVYQAKIKAAHLATRLGKENEAKRLSWHAERLKEQFNKVFWNEDLQTFVLAIDGSNRPCEIKTSNAGHCLFSGIASDFHGRRVIETLMAPDSFSGWGVRTLAADQARFNPMTYHNGTIWPHDNAMIAVGMARYGHKDYAAKLLNSFFDASAALDMQRLPELFCGFERRPGEGPTLYPLSCAPQAWAAGAVFMMLAACLGLQVDAYRHTLSLRKPYLPKSLEHITIRRMPLGFDFSVDLDIHRHADDVEVRVLSRRGPIEVIVMK